jgi:hypothetical protein
MVLPRARVQQIEIVNRCRAHEIYRLDDSKLELNRFLEPLLRDTARPRTRGGQLIQRFPSDTTLLWISNSG